MSDHDWKKRRTSLVDHWSKPFSWNNSLRRKNCQEKLKMQSSGNLPKHGWKKSRKTLSTARQKSKTGSLTRLIDIQSTFYLIVQCKDFRYGSGLPLVLLVDVTFNGRGRKVGRRTADGQYDVETSSRDKRRRRITTTILSTKILLVCCQVGFSSCHFFWECWLILEEVVTKRDFVWFLL